MQWRLFRHEYVNTGERPMPDLVPFWVVYKCQHCGETSGLREWQMREMPVSMAKCSKSNKKIGLLDRILGYTDCVAK